MMMIIIMKILIGYDDEVGYAYHHHHVWEHDLDNDDNDDNAYT